MQIIHIAGLPRSGTTLLQAFVMTDPQTCTAGGECAFPGLLADVYAELMATWDDDTRYFFSDKDAMRAFCDRVVDEFLRQYVTEVESSKIFVLKNTNLRRSVGSLRRMRQHDGILCLFRDPRDYVASHLSVIERKRASGLPTMGDGELNEWVGVLAREADEGIRTMMQTPDCCWIRYEDLVSNPSGTARMLKDTFGLECSAERLWSRMNFNFLRSSESDNRFYSSPDWEKPITTRNVGQYRKLMTEQQIEMVESQCADVMREFRYL